MVKTFIAAIIGGSLFQFLHIPVPWLLGPMIVMAIGKNVFKWGFAWPNYLRNTGMILVGYTIGLTMTSDALHEMTGQLPSMFLMTLLLMLLSLGIALIISKVSRLDFQSALLGSIPGGMTQIILLAEETKGINLAAVTLIQAIRLMIIVIMIPLLVFLPFFAQRGEENMITGQVTESVGLFPNLLFFLVACVIFAVVGNKIRFPTAYLLGPVIGTSLLQLTGLDGPQLPMVLTSLAQLMIGTHIGLILDTAQIQRKKWAFSLAISSGLLLMGGSILFSILLVTLHDVSKATALLSLAPGGMDQMGIIAHEIKADLSIVSGYQLFRTFFIFFAVPPMFKLLLKVMERQKHDGKAMYDSKRSKN